jgi:hypothetical protein
MMGLDDESFFDWGGTDTPAAQAALAAYQQQQQQQQLPRQGGTSSSRTTDAIRFAGLIAPVRNQLLMLEMRREEQLPRAFARRLQSLRERHECMLLAMRQQVHFMRAARDSAGRLSASRRAGEEHTQQREVGLQELLKMVDQQNKEIQHLKAQHEQQRQQVVGASSRQQQGRHNTDNMFVLQRQLILELAERQGNWTVEQQLQLVQQLHAADDQHQHQQRAGTPPEVQPSAAATAAAVRDQGQPQLPQQQQQQQQQQQWEQPPSQQQMQEVVRDLDAYERQLFKFERKHSRKTSKHTKRMTAQQSRTSNAGAPFCLPASHHWGLSCPVQLSLHNSPPTLICAGWVVCNDWPL